MASMEQPAHRLLYPNATRCQAFVPLGVVIDFGIDNGRGDGVAGDEVLHEDEALSRPEDLQPGTLRRPHRRLQHRYV